MSWREMCGGPYTPEPHPPFLPHPLPVPVLTSGLGWFIRPQCGGMLKVQYANVYRASKTHLIPFMWISRSWTVPLIRVCVWRQFFCTNQLQTGIAQLYWSVTKNLSITRKFTNIVSILRQNLSLIFELNSNIVTLYFLSDIIVLLWHWCIERTDLVQLTVH